MNKEKRQEELKRIAKKFCENKGYNFVFANDYKIGFEYKKQFYTLTYFELYELLKGEE